MINKNNLDEILHALDRQIEVHGGSPISLVVCGGTALFALGLILRTTKDIDVLGIVSKEHGQILIKRINKFPKYLIEASKAVQKDFGLPEGWINKGPTSQVDSGLPHGFEERLVEKKYGNYLSIYYISRLDQIFFKLYAAVDRNDYHVDDLFQLKPTQREIEEAARWVLTQDVSIGFKTILIDFLRKHGYEDISKRI
ncbi:MAG TPA: DUF6036 family nucleotidyltransferase [Acidobacteriota bacterium]|nr:DUF6036 family nucleotidyltransferase [Acidobacteriota bacterium]